MNILIDILHPAHVHFFKGYIEKSGEKGQKIIITTRNKEITNALLDRLGFPYIHVSAPSTGLPEMVMELFCRWWKIYRLMKKHCIDVSMSIAGLSTALPARLQKIPNINFTDTEDARLSNRLSFPFSDVVATPEFFLDDLGEKHFRYNGLHEMAYLKYFDFKNLAGQIRSLGLPKQYVIIRLVAKDALHDAGISGISMPQLAELIERVAPMGQVYLNSQSELPPPFQKYRLSIPIEKIHIALAGALLFIGESPTMAVESSLLGTPAYLVSSRWTELGNMIHLEKEYDLLRNFSNGSQMLRAIQNIENPVTLKAAWSERAAGFRESSVEMIPLIEQTIQLALKKKRAGDGT